MSTPTTARPAVPGGRPAYVMKADCQRCERFDFPAMLVTASVVDKQHAKALKEAGYVFQPGLDPILASMEWRAAAPVIRLLPRGFVFVFYDKRGVWDVWQCFSDGTYKKLLEHVTPAEYAGKRAAVQPETAESVCQRGASNLPAGLITLIGAGNQPAIWVGYSPHLWTPQVLAGFHNDANKRLESMTLIWAQTWMDGGSMPGKGCVPLNEEALKHNVVDFNDEVPPGGAKFNPMVPVFQNAVVPLPQARFGQARALVDRVRLIEKTAGPKAENKAIIAYVRDPIGLAEEFAALVGQVQSEYTEFTALGPKRFGKRDPDWAWKHQSTVNVRYVQAWAVEVARRQVEAKAQQWLNGPQNAPMTREAFEANKRNGLYPPGTVWKPLTRTVDGQPQPHPEGLGRVVYSQAHVERAAQAMGQEEAKGRSERYLGKVDMAAVEDFEKLHKGWNDHWEDRFVSTETDRVAWLESQPIMTCMTHQFDAAPALCGKQRPNMEVRIQVQEAFDRLAATERAYGMAAMTPVMLTHMVKMFGKDESDKTHWIAQALLTEFDLAEGLLGEPPDHGMRADLYDVLMAKREDWGEFYQAWQRLREPATLFAEQLARAAVQATAVMTAAALDAEKAKRYGLALTAEDASKKRVLWVRASALLHFLGTSERQYFVFVKWKAGRWLDAAIDALKAPMFELKFNTKGARQQQTRAKAASSSAAQLRRLQGLAGMHDDMLVPLLLDQEAIKNAAQRRNAKMLQVVGPNLLGMPQAVTELPEEFAREVLREQALFRQGWLKRLVDGASKNKLPMLTGGGVMFLQAYALSEAIDDFSKKGGVEQVDAAAAVLSSALGVMGAAFEVGYVLALPKVAEGVAAPRAAEVASRVPRHIVLRYGAGLLGAGGAFLDMVSAFAKARSRFDRGDMDATAVHALSGAFHASGGVGMSLGSYMTWRSALLSRVAFQGAVRVALLPATGVSALAGLGLTVSGIGLMLWIGGVAIGIIATILEDDECESFLRRTYFGIGGDSLMKKFSSVDEETHELGALARGMKIELEWNDELVGPDEITARITSMDWIPDSRGLALKMEGYRSPDDAVPVAVIADGDIQMPESPDRQGMHVVTVRYAVPEKGVNAVRCSFVLYDTTHAAKTTPAQRWDRTAGATKLARGYAWIKDFL
ncbi:hypothetical protein M8A51_21825 [Schlegelella sp. S2-27]|uniref:Toxin VasX N-terminal region domain-containing protein n=1 Tax=Caldimonas mangrovi TaxID=2944811 RepID=A0ABT0YTU2_9BURK|nr:T6SS effector BTH_I2691 family protein [Caldimonas mangrovi]MCM5682176.1 hypothetical protein [Caldimonas mangrovi]